MFCKKCGKELMDGANVCTGCGFKVGAGSAYCAHCGEPTAEGQYICVKCGFVLDNDEMPVEKPPVKAKPTSQEYKKYTMAHKKAITHQIVAISISLVLILCTIFLPIFQMSYKTDSLSEFRDWYGEWIRLTEGREMTLEDLTSDKITASQQQKESYTNSLSPSFGENISSKTMYIYEDEYSLFDEVVLVIGGFFNQKDTDIASDVSSMLGMVTLMNGLFSLIAVIVAIPVVIKTIQQLIQASNEYKDLDKATLLRYNEIRKSGRIAKEKGFLKKQSVYSFIYMIVMAILFNKIMPWDTMLPSSFDISIRMSRNYMAYFSGFAGLAILALVLLIGYIVFDIMHKKISKKMLEDIVMEEQEA